MARMSLDDVKVNDERYGHPVGEGVLKNFAIGVSRLRPRTGNENAGIARDWCARRTGKSYLGVATMSTWILSSDFERRLSFPEGASTVPRYAHGAHEGASK